MKRRKMNWTMQGNTEIWMVRRMMMTKIWTTRRTIWNMEALVNITTSTKKTLRTLTTCRAERMIKAKETPTLAKTSSRTITRPRSTINSTEHHQMTIVH